VRLATFRRHADEPHVRQVGLVLGQGEHVRVHPFGAGFDLVELLAETPEWRDSQADVAAAGDGLSLHEIVLLPPVYPVAMRDFLTFEAHVDGMERGHGNPGPPAEWYESPVFLFMAPHAVTGAYDDIAMPPDTERFDFELEIAAVICRDVQNVSPADAHAAIGGYCVMNDWSARDVQAREMKLKLGPSKGKDFATTIGPWVVTADELDGFRDEDGFLDLAMTVSVNGTVEVIASGTCASGALAESWGRTGELTPPPLQVGDVVEMTIEHIGTITNRIVETEGGLPEIQPARRRVREEA
jgi:2-keto-4-pentenoate hydratase/2-oxohepta-3-ene-1,7-dioic acid hydratase in catechol pathway